MPAPPQLAFDRTHIHPGDRICVAVSGGADSVALLLALHAANSSPREPSASASPPSTSTTASAAKKPTPTSDSSKSSAPPRHPPPPPPAPTCPPAPQPAPAKPSKRPPATLRYEIFRTLLHSGEADAILTAHTLDDQAETVLMKLLRGAWTEGLGGIHPLVIVPVPANPAGTHPPPSPQHPPRRDRRLTSTPSTSPGAKTPPTPTQPSPATASATSSSRSSASFNPNLDQTLANLAELAREDEARWQAELARILPSSSFPANPSAAAAAPSAHALARPPSPSRSNASAPLDPALRRRVLRAAARQLGARLSFDETSRLLALCGFLDHPHRRRPNPAASLRLSGDLRAERSPRELRLTLAAQAHHRICNHGPLVASTFTSSLSPNRVSQGVESQSPDGKGGCGHPGLVPGPPAPSLRNHRLTEVSTACLAVRSRSLTSPITTQGSLQAGNEEIRLNSTVKQILIWVFMITCLVFLWQFVVKSTGAGQDKSISLTELLNDAERARSATSSSTAPRSPVTTATSKTQFHTTIPANYPDMYKTLRDHGVNITIKDQNSNVWLDACSSSSPRSPSSSASGSSSCARCSPAATRP